MRRVAPAIGLFFLAPLVSEYLLGDFPLTKIGLLFILAPLYGGGALLIREIVRRSGRGWPTIITLALAYAIVEEAFTTQTLFNPNYLHMNMGLLKPAYIPALGMGGWWTVFVLTLHTVWSVSVSIGLIEALVPERARTPWLKNVGLAITTVLFTLAAIASTKFEIKNDHFVASKAQFVWAAVVIVAAIVTAFLIPKASGNGVRASGNAPGAWVVGALALMAGSIFMITPNRWGWGAVGIYFALYLIVIGAVSVWSRRQGWGAMHRLALAGGAALAYAWHAFLQMPVMGRENMLVVRGSNAVLAAGLVGLIWIAARNIQRSSVGVTGLAPKAAA